MLPKSLVNLVCYLDGYSLAGLVTNVEFPKIEWEGESHKGGGMLGPIKVFTGLKEIELKLTLAEHNSRVLDVLAGGKVSGWRIMAACRNAADGSWSSMEITCNGRLSTTEIGKYDGKKPAEMQVTVSCVDYKLTMDGTVVHNVNLETGEMIINGTTVNQGALTAMGL